MTNEDFFGYEAARAGSYKWLAECYHTPAADIIQRAQEFSETLKPVCPQAACAVDTMNAAVMQENVIENLKVEFARLFVGPFALPTPPYGSVYLEDGRKVMGESTLDVRRRYREIGLDLAEDFKDAPDHITAELEFMYLLIAKELEAFNRDDPDAISYFLDKQQSFLRDHLGAWIAPFTQQVEEQTRMVFFSSLASATRLFVEHDLSHNLQIAESPRGLDTCPEPARASQS